MLIAQIQFAPWDNLFSAKVGNIDVGVGDYVIASTDFGVDAGRVISVKDAAAEKMAESPLRLNSASEIGSIQRVANDDDWATISDNQRQKEDVIEYCRKIIKKLGLEMKIIGSHPSFDGCRFTFAFIADGRVDFRDAVKELTRHFQKTIRLHQVGVRDEAKLTGDIGCCGLKLCCQSHLRKLGSVTSELAEQQQVAHRGSERLSGICGRLKCCLGYEKNLYDELAKNLPPVGTRVRTKHGRGQVIGWHTLRQSVEVQIDPEREGDKPLIVEVPINK
ncbi:hypothetical protein HZA71_01590 [Candidatus Falkowbacteria bacterium]|nr:hypothetical protein [Candidatus Falkowbacteria bacterium]